MTPPRHEPPHDHHPSRPAPPDAPTLGGRTKAATAPERTGPAERPTQPLVYTPGPTPLRGGGAPLPDMAPPSREEALADALQWLSGPVGQRSVGTAGVERMARRLEADAHERDAVTAAAVEVAGLGDPAMLDIDILALARTLRGERSTVACARSMCLAALGLDGSSDEMIAVARTWCSAAIARRSEASSEASRGG